MRDRNVNLDDLKLAERQGREIVKLRARS